MNMKKNNESSSQARIGVALGCIVIATLSRVALPPIFGHPSNFSPIDAIALFCGACFGKRFLAFVVPLLSIWVSDIFVDYGVYHKLMWFYPGFYWQYLAYIVIVILGFSLSSLLPVKNSKRPGASWRVGSLLAASLGSSCLFFLISNFGVWASLSLHPMYPHTLAGLLTCYTMAIPFFTPTLVSDLVYSAVLFGSFYAVVKLVLRPGSRTLSESV